MLVGICGGLCAGKRTVANFLVEMLRFQELAFENDARKQPQNAGVLAFPNAQELMNYVTPRWREHFVVSNVRDKSVLDELSSRPCFILISVDAPVTTRWVRHVKRNEAWSKPAQTLEMFLEASDAQMYHPVKGIAPIVDRASIKLINWDNSVAALHRKLTNLNITDSERLRPGWDAYFMQLASLAAKRSNCMKRRVGCVLVREKRVIATGYNGAPRGLTNCNDGGCARCNDGSAGGTALDTCLCLHAEENALLEAGRERVGAGATLYCDTCPCLTCSIKIVQVGISEVVYSRGYSMDAQTADVLREGGVRLRQYHPPRDGIVV
ncbi:cytidine deaminase-like protein [Sphaerosporella brunnea]|uniref:Deoxycytidylate deaminase n=1 Tax=Sphaerosporella brunnea TaxID=1250544 RepID=A0A5J5EZG5_9PEZI|nr:cytidine deaminase-like protein [Sphaerosporella brunnea]KAA8908238.1 cytidine deaminase-like protein [Sphaerosporella brunnea]